LPSAFDDFELRWLRMECFERVVDLTLVEPVSDLPDSGLRGEARA
jgi:hypothetical protein